MLIAVFITEMVIIIIIIIITIMIIIIIIIIIIIEQIEHVRCVLSLKKCIF